MHTTKQSARAGLAAALLLRGAAAASTNLTCGCRSISRDVVVIGGGASGSNAAVWLRDHGQSVVVVEKNSQLGGHTNYYTDPVSGLTFNVGVQAWMEYEDAFDFPARMNVSTSGSMSFSSNTYEYVDFDSGLPVSSYVAPATADVYTALAGFLEVLEEYQDLLLPSYENFSAAGSVPEDLLMPFSDFATKYGIEAAVPETWYATTMGLGDTMDVSAMWVMQATTNPMIEALLGTAAAAVPASGRLYDLYESVADFLGTDVLYSTEVVSSTRNDTGVTLVAQSTSGEVTCIEAKRLLLAIQPTPENLAPFDMDATEEAVFEQFNFSTVYAGILSHPSLQANISYYHTAPDAGSNYTVYPVWPQVGTIDYLEGTDGLFQFTAVGTEDYDEDEMKALIGESIDNMIAAGTIPESNGTLSFPIFANHGKMHPRLTAEAVSSGLIQQQVALQGLRSTWYTGAAWSAPFSTVLWEYNKVLLPSVIEGI